jgi:hypothetical protein
MLRSLGCNDRGIQHAIARFLAASTPEYDTKSLTFETETSNGKGGGNCLPKDIFDRVAADPAAATKSEARKPSFARKFRTSATASRNPSDESYWRPAEPKKQQTDRPSNYDTLIRAGFPARRLTVRSCCFLSLADPASFVVVAVFRLRHMRSSFGSRGGLDPKPAKLYWEELRTSGPKAKYTMA